MILNAADVEHIKLMARAELRFVCCPFYLLNHTGQQRCTSLLKCSPAVIVHEPSVMKISGMMPVAIVNHAHIWLCTAINLLRIVADGLNVVVAEQGSEGCRWHICLYLSSQGDGEGLERCLYYLVPDGATRGGVKEDKLAVV